jgi:predicted DNA-binding transcriptional regulator AlpA
LDTATAQSSSKSVVSQPTHDKLLTPEEAAAFLGLKMRTLRNYRRLRQGPAYLRLTSNLVRYRREDLLAWAVAKLEHPDQRTL